MYNIIMAVWVLEYMSDITNQKALLYFSSEKKAAAQEWCFLDNNTLSENEELSIKIHKILIM